MLYTMYTSTLNGLDGTLPLSLPWTQSDGNEPQYPFNWKGSQLRHVSLTIAYPSKMNELESILTLYLACTLGETLRCFALNHLCKPRMVQCASMLLQA